MKKVILSLVLVSLVALNSCQSNSEVVNSVDSVLVKDIDSVKIKDSVKIDTVKVASLIKVK
jgi:hypothetical protein